MPLFSSLMLLRSLVAAVLTVAALVAASAPAAAQEPAAGDHPVVAAAGDMACDPESAFFNHGVGDETHCRQLHTAELVEAGNYDAVLVLGDTQYEDASLWKFEQSYGPSWGRFKPITRPAIGNHEYFAEDGNGYFDYFNGPGSYSGPAGDRDKGYYSFDLGGWHIIALNSVCSRVGGCGPGSPQEQWLRADLAAHPSACTLAYFHHPMVTSSGLDWPSMEPLWKALYDHGAELALAGHAHHYERYAPMDATGTVDFATGIRQFVVGTGGKNLGPILSRKPQSESVATATFGILALTLRPDGYDWRFVRESGEPFEDVGSNQCHAASTGGRAPDAITGPASTVRGTAARLNAAVDPRNDPTTYRFEYGTTTTYGTSTPETPVAQQHAGRQAVTRRITGLRPGRLYHYRVVATNVTGTTYGENQIFRADARSPYADVVTRTPGLLSYWRLGDAREQLAFDERGLHLGLYTGSYTLGRRGVLSADRNRSAGFDGATASMRAYGPIISDAATITGWFRWSAGEVLMRDDSSTGGWFLAREGSRGRLSYRVGGVGFVTRRSLESIRDGAWHHIALTKDGGTVEYYIDGRRIHIGTGAGSAPATMPWYVMRNGPFEEHALGQADDLAVYDWALPPEAIRSHYAAGVGRVAPITSLRGPAGPTNDATPSLSLLSTRRGSSYRCLAKGPGLPTPARHAPCGSRRSLGTLVDGNYSFSAYAIDRNGVPDPTPVRTTFRVDTVIPEVTAEAAATTARRLARIPLTVHGTCTEGCRLDARLTLLGRDAKKLRLSRRARPLVIGRGATRMTVAGTRSLRVRLPRDVRRRLAKARSGITVTLTVTGRDAAGNARQVQQRLDLPR